MNEPTTFPGSKKQEKLLKASEVARILNVSRSLVYKLIQHGELRSVQIGGARRVMQSDLQAFIKANLYPSPDGIWSE
jgi:excisionase family DNA binding protein